MAKTAEGTRTESAMFRALMAVKPDDLSLAAWARQAGFHRSIFNGIRDHGNPTSQTVDKLLDAIDVSRVQLDAHLHPVRTEVRGTGMSTADVRHAWRGPAQARPVPLVGSAFGGEWEDGIEMTELHLAEVLDYLGRPPGVATDPDAYAVEIIGESMAPRFEPGERAFVSPRAPVRIGDDVIVQLKSAAGDEADQSERVTMVLIKRLVKRGPAHLELRQFNPDTTFRVEMARVAAVHRVPGRL